MVHGFINGGIDLRFGNPLYSLGSLIDALPQAPGNVLAGGTVAAGLYTFTETVSSSRSGRPSMLSIACRASIDKSATFRKAPFCMASSWGGNIIFAPRKVYHSLNLEGSIYSCGWKPDRFFQRLLILECISARFLQPVKAGRPSGGQTRTIMQIWPLQMPRLSHKQRGETEAARCEPVPSSRVAPDLKPNVEEAVHHKPQERYGRRL